MSGVRPGMLKNTYLRSERVPIHRLDPPAVGTGLVLKRTKFSDFRRLVANGRAADDI